MDGRSDIEVNLYAKGSDRSQLTVQHSKLANSSQVAHMRAYWSSALQLLKALLETLRR